MCVNKYMGSVIHPASPESITSLGKDKYVQEIQGTVYTEFIYFLYHHKV